VKEELDEVAGHGGGLMWRISAILWRGSLRFGGGETGKEGQTSKGFEGGKAGKIVSWF